jgi:hypothetical protein
VKSFNSGICWIIFKMYRGFLFLPSRNFPVIWHKFQMMCEQIIQKSEWTPKIIYNALYTKKSFLFPVLVVTDLLSPGSNLIGKKNNIRLICNFQRLQIIFFTFHFLLSIVWNGFILQKRVELTRKNRHTNVWK